MIRPDALRPWATAPDTVREFRAMLAADTSAQPRALVVLLGGAFAPESIPAASWRSVGPYRVALVGLEVARSIAAGRSTSAVAALGRPPPPRGTWCVALGGDGTVLVWSTPAAVASHSPAQPSPASTPSPAEALADEKRARLAAYADGAQLPLWSPGGDA